MADLDARILAYLDARIRARIDWLCGPGDKSAAALRAVLDQSTKWDRYAQLARGDGDNRRAVAYEQAAYDAREAIARELGVPS
ncbi:hypothetical protein SAMN02982929_07173 [Saccharopolyspora kobensis]|uniref:Uncharacterized protein n=1 Tax=Saccharopolyspora kobensis TaxID=146035 RepID=A0A1H6ENZ4_9PSEU|nr:hypothetical protein [Saccharopolyspora kobensis]SEG98655.1 hypothetical protein SAMN02982929_07173 [Saccharopolyspora kobensis]SFD24109.1 hypothetical protein SAMN05216506_103196 [Saccharopolyspora kobensis]